MNIKHARIHGVLQDFDIWGCRYDIERINVRVPLGELAQASDEDVAEMIERGFYGNDLGDSLLGELVSTGIEAGWFKWQSRWELDDPCELALEVFE